MVVDYCECNNFKGPLTGTQPKMSYLEWKRRHQAIIRRPQHKMRRLKFCRVASIERDLTQAPDTMMSSNRTLHRSQTTLLLIRHLDVAKL